MIRLIRKLPFDSWLQWFLFLKAWHLLNEFLIYENRFHLFLNVVLTIFTKRVKIIIILTIDINTCIIFIDVIIANEILVEFIDAQMNTIFCVIILFIKDFIVRRLNFELFEIRFVAFSEFLCIFWNILFQLSNSEINVIYKLLICRLKINDRHHSSEIDILYYIKVNYLFTRREIIQIATEHFGRLDHTINNDETNYEHAC